MIFDYGIAVVDVLDKVIHVVTYPKEPSYREYLDVILELANDEEFGLTDLQFGVDYDLVPAPQWLLDDMKKRFEENDPDLVVTTHGEEEGEQKDGIQTH